MLLSEKLLLRPEMKELINEMNEFINVGHFWVNTGHSGTDQAKTGSLDPTSQPENQKMAQTATWPLNLHPICTS
jgi:hypothetical protein